MDWVEARSREKGSRGRMRRKVLHESGHYRRLLEEQIAAVVVLGRGEKNDAMCHVPHHHEFNHRTVCSIITNSIIALYAASSRIRS